MRIASYMIVLRELSPKKAKAIQFGWQLLNRLY